MGLNPMSGPKRLFNLLSRKHWSNSEMKVIVSMSTCVYVKVCMYTCPAIHCPNC